MVYIYIYIYMYIGIYNDYGLSQTPKKMFLIYQISSTIQCIWQILDNSNSW